MAAKVCNCAKITLTIITLAIPSIGYTVPVRIVNPMESHSHTSFKIIQCGAFVNLSYAQARLGLLKKNGIPNLTIKKRGSLHMVISSSKKNQIKNTMKKINKLVPDAFIKEY